MIAPWLTENNPLDLMRAGAGVGLQIRAANLAEQEAAARQAHYEAQQQLAAQEAARQLRAQKSLEAYRGTEEQHRLALERAQEAAQALREKSSLTDQALRERHQTFLEKQASLPTGEKLYHAGDKWFSLNPDGTPKVVFDAAQGLVSPVEKAKLNQLTKLDTDYAKDLGKLQRQYTVESFPLKSGQEETGKMQALRQNMLLLEKQRGGLQDQIRSLTSPAANTSPLPNATPSAVTIREKSTGKTFRYKGDPNDVPTDKYDIVP